MIGWSITVIWMTPEEYPLKLDRDAVLANWKVGAMGTRWLNKLVAAGEARQVKSGGYPNIYTAPVGSIVPLLLGHELPSDEDVPMRKPHEITIERDKLAMCSADETLTIVVWDQS
ncbi:hypothetical protein [Sphingomonas sp. CFBP 8765]|uniref:hypothetical protein n=1 Tax=Sphingomonas sp. CFBP 8765 TaxID=2775274 RepID=UPI00177C05EF|nr:hypothetical protein [Sphingomonas sp. CFBP 8765]MBD8472155.1 hypothetical protein [Sphingomonas sp. CFBP 8765]